MLTLTLRFDGLGRFFAGIVATLWPLTVLYASEYMKHEERQAAFFAFFTLTYGITLGVAMAANLFTMYSFYELLTLSTVALVMHPMTRRAVRAAKTYLAFSLGGAAFAFVSIMYIIGKGHSGSFLYGGFLRGEPDSLMLVFYVMGFLGFGVKAAVFPTHVWLPKASVAPTPVTALLHAVAVVKSGVFAVIRLTWFAYGTEVLKGSWAQTVVMCFAIFTIFFGASMAVKEQHWKRRLAYSTVANLSYILFGVTMMTQAGLTAALLHMAFHAEIKILAFFWRRRRAAQHRTGVPQSAGRPGQEDAHHLWLLHRIRPGADRNPAFFRLRQQMAPAHCGSRFPESRGLCRCGGAAVRCAAHRHLYVHRGVQGFLPRRRFGG